MLVHFTLLCSSIQVPFKLLCATCFFMLFHWPCLLKKLPQISWLNLHPSAFTNCIFAIPVNPHLCYVPETSFQCGRLPQSQLIGCHWATNPCHSIINTCCVITDTCFRLHWLFYAGKIQRNEWQNAFPHLRQSPQQSSQAAFHQHKNNLVETVQERSGGYMQICTAFLWQ